MIVTCPTCKKIYDDARCWTVCPQHNSLDVGARAPYCEKHDLYNCYLCDDGKGRTYREILGEYEDPQERELHDLRGWKAEYMAVEATWNEQEVGRLMDLTIGTHVRENIQPFLEQLLQRCKNAEEARDRARTTICGYKVVWREMYEKMKQLNEFNP